jgi:hypothetical protein
MITREHASLKGAGVKGSNDRLTRIHGTMYAAHQILQAPDGAFVISRGDVCVFAFQNHVGQLYWSIGRVVALSIGDNRSAKPWTSIRHQPTLRMNKMIQTTTLGMI